MKEEPQHPRVLLVDDHELYRAGLRLVLSEHDIEVVGEAATGEAAVRMAAELEPDVIVMDLRMPGMSGGEATERLATAAPRSRVLVLTVSLDTDDAINAIMAGACGYLLKDATASEVMAGIRSAAAGDASIAPAIASTLLDRVRRERATDTTHDEVQLSGREIEVLRLIANGKDNGQIAQELVISPRTVKNHISNILAKLKIDNRIQAAVYAVRSGLV